MARIDPAELLEEGAHLADAIRRRVGLALAESRGAGDVAGLARPVGRGVGDVSFAIDAAAEEEVATWHTALARRGPVSLLSEETGWVHRPDNSDGDRSVLVIDPIDGTRNLLADLRPAWTALAVCKQPGDARDIEAGLLSELPTSNAATWRELAAVRGRGCRFVERTLEPNGRGRELARRILDTGDDDRVDHGYFPFFRYAPAMRPALAEIEAAFFARLAKHENAELAHCYDDQYICNAGQLALLALGTYRFVADLRAWLGARLGMPSTTAKAYDVAAAIVVAREAGCIVEAPLGGELDFPLDATTPVSFVGYANAATAERLRPHLTAVLR